MKNPYSGSLKFWTRIKIKSAGLLVLLMVLANSFVFGQAVKCPPNIDFSYGNLTNWYCYAGSVTDGACATCPSVSDPGNPIIYTGPIPGSGSTPGTGYPYFSGQHNVTTGTNVDPYGFFPQVCPAGGAASVMVGNDVTGRGGERIRYYVHVPAGFNNYSFAFEYACVLENPTGHSFAQQPAFFVRGYDSATGTPIQCATLTYVSDASLPGFTLSSTQGVAYDVLYLPWTKGTLNLSGQGGKTIIVEVESHDCTLSGHFGYGYFDIVQCGQFNAVIAKCDLSNNIVKLQAPSGYKNYYWYKGPTIAGAPVAVGPSPKVAAPTVPTFYYCVLVPYNSNGCPDTIRTKEFVDFRINATPDTVCNSLGKPIQLDVNVISGGFPGMSYDYDWMADPTLSATKIKNPVARPTGTGIYVVTVSDSSTGCFREDTVVIQNPTFKIDLGPDITTCLGTPVTLSPSLTPPGPGYIFKWTGTDMTALSDSVILGPKYTPNAVGMNTYKIRVDSGVCAAEDSFNIRTLPNTFDVRDTALCEFVKMDSTNVLVSGDPAFSYSWTPTRGLSNSHVQTPTITADTTRTYAVTASYPKCPDIVRNVTIRVEPKPFVNLGPDSMEKCFYTPLYLQAKVTPTWYSDYTYTWDANPDLDNTNTEQVTFTGTQTVKLKVLVTTPLGCFGRDSMVVVVYNGDFGTVSPSDSAVCPRNPVTLTAGGGVKYRWTPALYLSDTVGKSITANPKTSMDYTLYVIDKNNCVDTLPVHLQVYSDALVSVPDTAVLYPGQSIEMNPRGNALYYSWFPTVGLSNPGITNPVASPSVNTLYYVTGTTEAGCSAVDSIYVLVNDESVIDMANAFSPGSETNPVYRVLHLGTATLKSFEIFNRWGQKLFETADINQGWDGRFNNTPQPMGVYVYRVEAVTAKGKTIMKQGNLTLLR